MPARLFPLPIRVGTDICKISRFYTPLSRPACKDAKTPWSGRHRILYRLFTEPELTLFWQWQRTKSHVSPHTQLDDVVQYVATRWAAKEAVIKAYNDRRLLFEDIIVMKDKIGVPFAIVLDAPQPVKERLTPHYHKSPRLDGLAVNNQVVGAPCADIASSDDQTSSDAEESEDEASYFNPPAWVDWNFQLDTESIDGQILPLSISHDGGFVIATCLAPVQTLRD